MTNFEIRVNNITNQLKHLDKIFRHTKRDSKKFNRAEDKDIKLIFGNINIKKLDKIIEKSGKMNHISAKDLATIIVLNNQGYPTNELVKKFKKLKE